ncbi:MAG: alcohol dehydrogenase family protein [Acidimicrobiia bacterium]
MVIPELMHGVVLTGSGGPDRLEWRDDLAVPEPQDGDVLIRVGASAVNNTDINMRTGWYSEDASWSGEPVTFPRIQGADVCGRIVAVGPGVEQSRVGERVLVEPCIREADGHGLQSAWYLGSDCDGGFAEYTRVASRHAHRVASPLSDVELASFPCSYSTAENMLTRSDAGQGETVLVTGASGGVGSAAVQLLKTRGARVVAVTSPEKAETMRELGADLTIDRDADYVGELGRGNVDVVVDLVAGHQWHLLLDVLRPGGRYVVAGAIGGALVELDVRKLYLKDLSFFGCTVLDTGVFGRLVESVERGDVRPLISEIYPLRRLAEAQAAFQEKGHVGKIVIAVNPENGL